MKWFKRLVNRVRRLGRRRVSYAAPAGRYVHYSTRFNCCQRCVAPVQQTVVVDREGMKQSEYVTWLN